jgi:hypothetical protein
MKQLLGFAVLTGPLFLIVLWVPVCVAIGFLVGKKFIKKSLTLKIIGGLAIFLIMLLLPVSDEIAGRIYFNHLCETEAGVKVYQTIELPAEYWDEDGNPKFYKGANNNDVPSYAFKRLGIDIDGEWVEKKRLLQVIQFGTVVNEKKSGKKYSEVVRFGYTGGWIMRELTPHPSGLSCRGGSFYDELVQQQFIPAKEERGDYDNNK